MKLDSIDTNILEQLEKDARTPFLKIAKQLKVSEGTIRKRVSKLVENDVIKKFTIELKNASSVIIGIETDPHIPTKEIVAELMREDVRYCYEVAGRFDLICYLTKKAMEDINETLEKIRIMKGVVHTETFTILKEN